MNALWLVGLLGLSASVSAARLAPERSAIRFSSYDLPLTFEVNQGQTDARVDFLARGQGYTLFLTPTEAVFALTPPRVNGKRSGNGRESPQPDRTVMRMQLVNSVPDPEVHGLEQLPGKVNYFRGNDATHWQSSLPTYRKVRYASVYPGVDLIYYGQPQQLEYDFIVAPGADPTAIKLAFSGVDHTVIDERGDLVLRTAGEPLRLQKPIIYQMNGDRPHIVDGSYVQVSSHEVGFHVGAYDRTRALIIDPVLSYSTYLGGSGFDEPSGLAVDATGAAFVTGNTTSTDFPTANALQPALVGTDAFIAKLTPDGTALAYSTYLGGSSGDSGRGIAVDSAGAAYVTGDTSSADFPVVRAGQATLRGARDAFVAKLSADGSQLIYSTYLGGDRVEVGQAIAIDVAGAAYITGPTTSEDFPTSGGGQPVCTGLDLDNAFVSKITPDGTALAYSSYLAGGDFDYGTGIAVDSVGAAYVTGFTYSANFPNLNPIHPFRGLSDVFVTKLAPRGNLIYSTFVGGSDEDFGNSIAVDTSGSAYVTGLTRSPDFPTVNALQTMQGGNDDGFVAKLPPEGGALIYATYLGGSGGEFPTSIAVDSAGAVHVTGETASLDFPTMNPLKPDLAGIVDTFVAKFRSDGAALVFSTYLGGGDQERGGTIALDPAGAVYVAGSTTSADFPTVRPLQDTYAGGGPDAFIAKITGDNLAAPGSGIGSDVQSGDDSGGGSIDALLAILLAQLAFARALRRNVSVA